MIRQYPQFWRLIVGLSLLTAIIYCCITVPTTWSIYLAVGSIVLLGIPHGAADHQLFGELYAKRYGTWAMLRFYTAYLGAIALVVAGWVWLPQITLLLFIIGSAYHFGQSNFQYLTTKSLGHLLLIMIWGLWVIVTPIYFHSTTALPILTTLLQSTVPTVITENLAAIWYGLTLGSLLGIIVLAPTLNMQERLQECGSLLALGCLFWFTPLFLGFGLYFSLWHAGPSAMDQIRFFRVRHQGFNWKRYLLTVLPFSIAAISSIALASYFLGAVAITPIWWSIIFGGIAALTLPHMLILDRVYEQLNQYD